MLIAGLDSQLRQYLHFRANATTHAVLGALRGHLVGQCDKREVCLLHTQVVDVILQEEGIAHPAIPEHLVIRQSDDMLSQHVVGWHEIFLYIIPAVVARTVQRVAQIEQMLVVEGVSEVGFGNGQRTLEMAL